MEQDPNRMDPKEHNIFGLAEACVKSFLECLSKVEGLSRGLVEDQLGRFNIWTSNIGVFAPGRAGMDYRLKDAPEIRSLVLRLLDTLRANIDHLNKLVNRQTAETPSSKRAEDIVESLDLPKVAVEAVAHDIGLLHKLSNSIRKASIESRDIKAATFEIKDDEGNDLSQHYKEYFAALLEHKFPDASQIIRDRLAAAMLLRRKRFLYRRDRQAGNPIRLPGRKPELSVQLKPAPVVNLGQRQTFPMSESTPRKESQHQGPHNKVTSVAATATTLDPERYLKVSAPSRVSTAKSTPVTENDELDFPPAPRVSEVGEVTCPYCSLILPASEIRGRRRWTEHVKSDLDAYVCLFEECADSPELYSRSQDWLTHMRQAHMLQWLCRGKLHKHKTFETRAEFENHMVQCHKATFTDKQLSLLSARSAQPIGPVFASCPLCGRTTSNAEGMVEDQSDHVVGHLRFLALKCLPWREDIEEVPPSNNSTRSGVRSTIVNDSDYGTRPMFEESGQQLLQIEEHHSVSFPAGEAISDTPINLREHEWGFILTLVALKLDIIAVLQLSENVISICYEYRAAAKHAARDANRITDEVNALRDILEQLLKLAVNESINASAHLPTLELLNKPDGPLIMCQAELLALKANLEPQNGWRAMKKALSWPLREGEVNKTLDRISRFKETLNIALKVDQRYALRAIHDDLTVLKELYSSDRLDEYRRKVRRWLAAPDPASNHNAAREKHQQSPTTGVWLLASRQFAEWMTYPYSFLWLHGIPGCGKTILCSTVIQEVVLRCQSDPTLAIAYFYFDFNDTERQSCNNLIRSLIEQLSSNCQKIPDLLLSIYSRCQDGQKQPMNDDLLAILLDILKEFHHTYIVIDALDECKERKEELLPFIKQIIDWKLANVHVLVTSRKEKEIGDSVEPLVTDQLSLEELLDGDIRILIRERLQDDQKLRKWPAQLQTEIEETLTDGAHGMFRWVVCQLDALRKCRSADALKKTLKSLPKTLDDTYTRILLSIDDDDRGDAFRILQWLCFSARPVRLEEMVEVLAVELGQTPRFNADKRLEDPREILTICPSLVSIAARPLHPYDRESVLGELYAEEEVEEVRLAHFSVKEYLVSERIFAGPTSNYSISEIPAHVSIAETCVAYLLHFDTFDWTSNHLHEYPLSLYAAEYWTQHYRTIGDDASRSCLDDLSIKLLRNEGKCFVNWLRLFDPEDKLRGQFYKTRTDVAPPLYYASWLGFIAIATRLLEIGAEVNAQGGSLGSALQAASTFGDEQVVKLLIDNGADVNLQGGYYGSALQAAICNDHAQITKLLLDSGADVNAQDGEHGDDALRAASSQGHEQIVKLLLKGGTDVSGQGGFYGNALQAASSKGHEEVVKLLLDVGADVNMQDGLGRTALQTASSQGYEKVVKLLLDRGADINAQGGDHSNALQEAASGGHEKIVMLLLDSGAEVTSDALQAFASNGHAEAVRLLLEKDLDVDKSDALDAAASAGWEEIVKLLLDKDPGIATDGALYKAVVGGHQVVVRLLLDNGAVVTSDGLGVAASEGREEILKLLLDENPSIGTDYAFYKAVAGGHEVVVRLLLENGAVVTCDVLGVAASLKVSKMLITDRVSHSKQGEEHGNRQQMNLYWDHKVCIRRLLNNGVNVDSSFVKGATSPGHESMVKLELDYWAAEQSESGEESESGKDSESGGDNEPGEDNELGEDLQPGLAARSVLFERFDRLHLQRDLALERHPRFASLADRTVGEVVKLLPNSNAAATLTYRWTRSSGRRWSIG